MLAKGFYHISVILLRAYAEVVASRGYLIQAVKIVNTVLVHNSALNTVLYRNPNIISRFLSKAHKQLLLGFT